MAGRRIRLERPPDKCRLNGLAAVFLLMFIDPRRLVYAVNIDGFGLTVGSLANLIFLRMAPDKRA